MPVSNQWDKTGYVYPIQVAQYGLSSYSKLLSPDGRKNDRFVNCYRWSICSYSIHKAYNHGVAYEECQFFVVSILILCHGIKNCGSTVSNGNKLWINGIERELWINGIEQELWINSIERE